MRNYLQLIKELAWADFKLRYNNSALGLFWSFLKPLLMVAVLYIIFSMILKNSIENYILFLLIGIILWNFLVESTSISMNNMLLKKYVMQAIYLPREVLPISSCLNAFITLSFNMLILLLIMIFSRIDFSIYALSVIVLLAGLFMITLGISFILSALYVKYRDVTHIWDVMLQAGFWISPIAYSADIVPEKLHSIYMLNPIASIITQARNVLIYSSAPDWWNMLFILLSAGIIMIAGYYYYNHKSKYFADEL